MADAIVRLLADGAQAGALARAGLEEVRRYTWDEVSQTLARLYARVTVAAPHPRADPNHA
jgi:glycosyltransferase involved in cell wall biosynthesis